MIALILLGFGHRPLSAQVNAYVISGGSLSDLCGGENAPDISHATCRACLITSSSDLCAPTALPHIARGGATLMWAMRPKSVSFAHLDPLPQARGPPTA